jgi:hypothetical protein
MSYQITVGKEIGADGRTYSFSSTLEASAAVGVMKTGVNALAAAKVGALTGELTMAGGHGITTGARLDVYWSGGSRYGMTVGTVATNQVPVDGGAGDVLPADETAVTAMVPVQENLAVTGNDVVAIVADAAAAATVVFTTSAPADVLAVEIAGATAAYFWQTGEGTNPMAGAAVAKVYLSHGDSTAARDVRAQVFYD